MVEPLSSGEPSDSELLQRHLKGDAAAFAAIVERYKRELYNFLVRFTGDPSLAEDVFQETFLQLHLAAVTFDPGRRLKPWLFTIAANKARDAIRSRHRRQAAPLDAALAGDEGRSSYLDLMPSDIPPPEQAIENQEVRSAVEKIVMEMPEGLRAVLLLGYFEEFPYKEIADMLDLPLGTVKSRLHAAVRYFAKKWKSVSGKPGHDVTK